MSSWVKTLIPQQNQLRNPNLAVTRLSSWEIKSQKNGFPQCCSTLFVLLCMSARAWSLRMSSSITSSMMRHRTYMNSGNSLTTFRLTRSGRLWPKEALRMICRIWMILTLKLKKNSKIRLLVPLPQMLRWNQPKIKSTNLQTGFTFKNLTSDRQIVSRRNIRPFARSWNSFMCVSHALKSDWLSTMRTRRPEIQS